MVLCGGIQSECPHDSVLYVVYHGDVRRNHAGVSVLMTVSSWQCPLCRVSWCCEEVSCRSECPHDSVWHPDRGQSCQPQPRPPWEASTQPEPQHWSHELLWGHRAGPGSVVSQALTRHHLCSRTWTMTMTPDSERHDMSTGVMWAESESWIMSTMRSSVVTAGVPSSS